MTKLDLGEIGKKMKRPNLEDEDESVEYKYLPSSTDVLTPYEITDETRSNE